MNDHENSIIIFITNILYDLNSALSAFNYNRNTEKSIVVSQEHSTQDITVSIHFIGSFFFILYNK